MEVTFGRVSGQQPQQKALLGEEKFQMWDLNKRLESYLSKVKFLEEENELLRGEIDHRKKDRGARSWKAAFEEELRQAREKVEEAWRRKDRAELERDNLSEEMEGVRARRHKEITAQEEVKERLRETGKVLEEERRSQIWMREKAAQLEKELQLMMEVHQEETLSLKTQISESRKKSVAPSSFSSSSSSSSLWLGDLGLDYSARAAEMWKTATEAYQNQVARLEDTLAQARARLAQVSEEKKEGYLRVQGLAKELEGARMRKEMLEEKVSMQWGRQQRELEKIQAEVESLEREKQSLEQQMADILSDKQNLTQLKMSLSLEVTTYRVLLDSESCRIKHPTAGFTTGPLHKDDGLESSLKELRGRVRTPLTARPQSSPVYMKLDATDVRGPQCTPPPKPNPKTTAPNTAIDKRPLETLRSPVVDPSPKENIIQETEKEGFSVMENVMTTADSARQAPFKMPGETQDKISCEDQGDLFRDDVKTEAWTKPAEDNLPSMHSVEPEWGQSFENQLSEALEKIKDEDRDSLEASYEDHPVVKDGRLFETYRQDTAISQSTALEVSSQACPEVLADVEASVSAEISHPQSEEIEPSKPSWDVREERVEDSKNGESLSKAQQAVMELDKSKEEHPSRTEEEQVTIEEKVWVAGSSHEESQLSSEDNTEMHSSDAGTVKHPDELMKPQMAITTNLVQELKTELHTVRDQVSWKLGETDPEDDLCSQEKEPPLTKETGEADKSLLEEPERETLRGEEMEAEESTRDLGSTDSSLDTSEDASELNHDEHVTTDIVLKGPSQALEPSLSPTAQETVSKTEEIGDSSDIDEVSSETERDDHFEEEQAAELMVDDQATLLGENKVPDAVRSVQEISTEEFVGKTEAELEEDVFVEKMDKVGNDGPADDFNLDAQLKVSSTPPDQRAFSDATESPSVSQSWRVEGGELECNDSYALENTVADTRTLIRYESDEDVAETTVPGSISEDAEGDLIAAKEGEGEEEEEEETGLELNIDSAKEENEKNNENLASLQDEDEMKEDKHLGQEARVATDESEDDSEGEILPDTHPEEAEEGTLEKGAETFDLRTEDFDGAPTTTVDENDQGEMFVEGNAEAGKDLVESELETEEESAEDEEVSLAHDKELDNETDADKGSHTEPVLEEDTQLELDNEVQKGFHSEELERAQEVESHDNEEEEEEETGLELNIDSAKEENEKNDENLASLQDEDAMKEDKQLGQEAGVATDESEDDSEGEILPDTHPEAEEGPLEKGAETFELRTEDFNGAPTTTVDEHDQGEMFVEGNAEAGKDLVESELETEEESAEDEEVSLAHDKELDLKVDNEADADRGSHTEPVLEEDTQLELDNEVQKGFHSEELERAQEVESHDNEEEEEESHSKESETGLEGADNERAQESLAGVMETEPKGDTEIKMDKPPEDGEFHIEEMEMGQDTETDNLVASPLGTKVDDVAPVADEEGEEDQHSEEDWLADKQSTGSLLDPKPDLAEELIEPVADSGDHTGDRNEEGHQNLSLLTNVDYTEELSLPSDRCNTSDSLSGANLDSEGSYSSEDESPNASQVHNETKAETEAQKPTDRQPASDSEDSTADSLEAVTSQMFQNEERNNEISPGEVQMESMQPEHEEREVLETSDPRLWQARDSVSAGKEADEGLHKLPGDLATAETVEDEYKSSFQNFWESPSSTAAEIDIFRLDPKDTKPATNGQQREIGDPVLLNGSSVNGKRWDEKTEAWRSTESTKEGFLDVKEDASGGKAGLDTQVNPEVQQPWEQTMDQRTEFREDGGGEEEDQKAEVEGGGASLIQKTEKKANAGEAVSTLLVGGDHPQDSVKGVFYGSRGHEEVEHSGDSLEEHDSWSSEGE